MPHHHVVIWLSFLQNYFRTFTILGFSFQNLSLTVLRAVDNISWLFFLLLFFQTFQGRFRKIMDSAQNALNQDTTKLTEKLDESEKKLFVAGQLGLHDFERWETRQTEKLQTSSMVLKHRKRKRALMEDTSWTQPANNLNDNWYIIIYSAAHYLATTSVAVKWWTMVDRERGYI